MLLSGCEADRPVKPGPDPIEPPASADEVIDHLAMAYRTMDRDSFDPLLANDPEHAAEFSFFLAGHPTGETSWGYGEEERIHRRMFTGQHVAGEYAIPPEYRMQAINVALTKITDWAEPAGIYSDTNPEGLAREKWKAVEARFSTHVFFDTHTDNDFLVEDEAIFTVIEDLEKAGTEPGRFLLLHWQDIDGDYSVVQMADRSWGEIKSLYRR